MPQLIIITLAAYLCQFFFFGDNLVEAFSNLGTDGFTIGGILDVVGALFGLMFFAPEGMPVAMTLVFVMLIVLPWTIVFVLLVLSLIPLT